MHSWMWPMEQLIKNFSYHAHPMAGQYRKLTTQMSIHLPREPSTYSFGSSDSGVRLVGKDTTGQPSDSTQWQQPQNNKTSLGKVPGRARGGSSASSGFMQIIRTLDEWSPSVMPRIMCGRTVDTGRENHSACSSHSIICNMLSLVKCLGRLQFIVQPGGKCAAGRHGCAFQQSLEAQCPLRLKFYVHAPCGCRL